MIYVGTCGFSYKDWIGPFYPGTIRQNEMLPYYANCFEAVEIDASYYGVLQKQTIARMNERTPGSFRFCFKVPQTVSHPPEAGMARVHGDARTFVESVAPIVDAGKFGCGLLQFPNAFKPNGRTEEYLRAAVEALQPLALVAEFRNREWQTPRYFELLCELGVGWCNVDMPSYETLMRPSTEVTGKVGYVRFHGRNASKWWTGDNRTRYEYDYSAQELAPWTNRVAEIDEQAETTYAFFNNHARGNAARNAELFSELLGMKRRARPSQDRLF
ncbi:MAG TPA: DUF72 domain-containing protein [Candidatus Baltobacteraceae bacterium]|nr:DUF72 domain-containing protein [Candidatus Baltobacteraceae bacterium]